MMLIYAMELTVCVKNNITINNQTAFVINTTIIIQGNIEINQSNINFNSIELIIDRDLTISNSTLYFNSSSIVTKGCIYLSNVNITVDLSKIPDNESKIVLLNSTSGCLDVNSYNLAYLNRPKCTTLTSEKDSYTLVVIFTHEENCGSESETQAPFASWKIVVIVIGIVVGIAIIFVILVLSIVPLRKIFLPYEKKKDEKDKPRETDLTALRDKMKTLKSEIKEVETQHQKVKTLLEEDSNLRSV